MKFELRETEARKQIVVAAYGTRRGQSDQPYCLEELKVVHIGRRLWRQQLSALREVNLQMAERMVVSELMRAGEYDGEERSDSFSTYLGMSRPFIVFSQTFCRGVVVPLSATKDVKYY